jgi:glycosyltransferase involved in cell wall biosynthesis/nucleotide-binding universal stress UspA family protein
MKKRYPVTLFRKICVPVIHACDFQSALTTARMLAGEGRILLTGIVYIPERDSLSMAATSARQLRKTLQAQAGPENNFDLAQVRVSHQPWDELRQVIREEGPDLLILEWPSQLEALHVTTAEVLSDPPCDIVLVVGPVPEKPKSVLVALRGGPFAELSLRVSISIARTRQAQIASLHLTEPGNKESQDAPYRGIEKVLSNLPEIRDEEVETENPAIAILERARAHDLIVIGATAHPDYGSRAIGKVAERVLENRPAGVLIVKTRRPLPQNMESELAGQTAISVLVDKWFAENTYHADEFSDLNYLLALKEKQGLSISLALPALNEEKTVGKVIETIKAKLMDENPLIDEIILIDSDSDDRTREIAAGHGVPVYIHQQILPQVGARHGKGEALWKSLFVTRGDIILWIDTDIVNIHPRFVYGLIGPLLLRPNIQFVKGFYRRPLKVGEKLQAGGGGRVTELTARPLLNLFYPEISGVIQPLSGEYGGRRAALDKLPFFSGYGVEIGLLIDIFETFGLNSIAQVDLKERIHHNQSLESLSKMSFEIIQAVIHKLERRYESQFLEEVNKSMKLIRYEPGRLYLEVEEIAEHERQPMSTIPEYQTRSTQPAPGWPAQIHE